MATTKQAKKSDDYRSLEDSALTDHIEGEELRLKKMHFAHSVNPIENPLSIRSLRRRLAQLKTEQNARKASK